MDAKFEKQLDHRIQTNNARFRTELQRICSPSDINLDELKVDLDGQVDRFTNLASGWNLSSIKEFTIHIARYRPLIGTSYIPTPQPLINKRCIVNVENYFDENCFQYAILSAMFPADRDSNRMSKYEPHINKLDWSGLSFPVKLPQIRHFERNNLNCTVNVYKYFEATKEKKEEIIPVYITRHMHRKLHINLLLISNEVTSHYVWIKNMSKLVAKRTNGKHSTFVCAHCQHAYTNRKAFENHYEDCSRHVYQKIVYPTGDDTQLFWKARSKTESYQFCCYADFESYLEEKDGKEGIVNEHKPSGFCLYTAATNDFIFWTRLHGNVF